MEKIKNVKKKHALQKFFEMIQTYLVLIFTSRKKNGSFALKTFGEIYARYQSEYLPTVTEATRVKLLGRGERFFPHLLDVPLSLFTPERIAKHVRLVKSEYQQGMYSKRFSFHKELKDLKAILTWWSDQYDLQFKNPVRRYHYALAVIEEMPEKNHRITMEETLRFLKSFPEKSLFHDRSRYRFDCSFKLKANNPSKITRAYSNFSEQLFVRDAPARFFTKNEL